MGEFTVTLAPKPFTGGMNGGTNYKLSNFIYRVGQGPNEDNRQI
jgi:hypothetical protein